MAGRALIVSAESVGHNKLRDSGGKVDSTSGKRRAERVRHGSKLKNIWNLNFDKIGAADSLTGATHCNGLAEQPELVHPEGFAHRVRLNAHAALDPTAYGTSCANEHAHWYSSYRNCDKSPQR